jgi:hypothetical protein
MRRGGRIWYLGLQTSVTDREIDFVVVLDPRHVHTRFGRSICALACQRGRHIAFGGCDKERSGGSEE